MGKHKPAYNGILIQPIEKNWLDLGLLSAARTNPSYKKQYLERLVALLNFTTLTQETLMAGRSCLSL